MRNEECIADKSPVDKFSFISSDSGSKSTSPKNKKLIKEGKFRVRKGRRVAGETRIEREKGDELLIKHVFDMPKAIC